MAKSVGSANKVSFGKRKSNPNGKKSYGPKAQAPKSIEGRVDKTGL
jgi:hypothetical protein